VIAPQPPHHRSPSSFARVLFSFFFARLFCFFLFTQLPFPSLAFPKAGAAWPASLYGAANPGLRHTFQLVDVPDFMGRGESTPSPHFYQVRYQVF
jgi:hypothetical protein